MDRRRFVITAASFGAVATAVAACAQRFSPNSGNQFSLADIAPASARYTLTTQYAKYQLGGYTFHTRTYNGAIPGPTLHVNTGEYLDVQIRNRLPKNPKTKCPPPGTELLIPDIRTEEEAMQKPKRYVRVRATNPIDCMNNPHDLNTTNLHVHGIQTVPHLFNPLGTELASSHMIAVEPGKSFSYHLPVPANHPSGLHWYHPHHHGSTDVQVGGGMAGLIVVHGPIDQVPEIAAAREVRLVIQSLNVNKGPQRPVVLQQEYVPYVTEPNGGYFVDTQYTMYTVAVQTDASNSFAPVSFLNRLESSFTPYPAPSLNVSPGEVIRLRLLNGTNADTLPLMFPGVEAWQIGFDGVNLLAPSLKDMSGTGPDLTPTNFINAPVRMTVPGNRIEFLIKMPDAPGTYTLSSKNAEAIHGPASDIALLNFVSSGPKKSMGLPNTLPKPEREYFDVPPNPFQRTFTFSFKQDTTGRILTGFNFLVNDTLYMESDVPTYVPLNAVEEWEIRNTTGAIHPFHIHVNSFQLLEINGVPNDTAEVWDTFYVPPKSSVPGKPYGSIKFRIKFQQFTGKTVFHCHFLSHEDTGMMQNFTIH